MSNVKTSTLNKTKVVSVVNLATELEEEGEEEIKRRRMRKRSYFAVPFLTVEIRQRISHTYKCNVPCLE